MRRQPHTEYSGPRSPGIRMMEPLAPSLGGPYAMADVASLDTYHLFDKAHLVMLAEEGLIPRGDAAAMLSALREMETKGVGEVRQAVGGGMHSGEQYLIRLLGYDVGGRIHLGRSTGDLGAVSRRVRQRDKLQELMRSVNDLRATILQVAEQHLETVMPGYTGSQHAQPVTLGHQLLAWASILGRHCQRAQAAFQRVNQSPAGAAILTGSNFPLNRHRTAELLGFDGVIRNTFDAIQGDDVAIEALTVGASVNLSLSKWANDITFWFTSESGYVDIPDRFCGSSSIMMQKRNPSILSSIRAAAAETMGGLITTFAGANTVTGEFTSDGGASTYRTFDQAIQGLGWLGELLPAMSVKKDRMLEMAGSYWAQGTDVAGALVAEKGLPWRTAHQIVGILVRYTYERGLQPRDVTTELLDEAAVEYMAESVELSSEALQKALDPVEFINGRTLFGGPAPQEARQHIPELYSQLGSDQDQVLEAERRLKESAEKLEEAIDVLIG